MDYAAGILIPLYLLAVGAFAVFADQRRSEVMLLGMWGLLGLGVLYEVVRVIAYLLL